MLPTDNSKKENAGPLSYPLTSKEDLDINAALFKKRSERLICLSLTLVVVAVLSFYAIAATNVIYWIAVTILSISSAGTCLGYGLVSYEKYTKSAASRSTKFIIDAYVSNDEVKEFIHRVLNTGRRYLTIHEVALIRRHMTDLKINDVNALELIARLPANRN